MCIRDRAPDRCVRVADDGVDHYPMVGQSGQVVVGVEAARLADLVTDVADIDPPSRSGRQGLADAGDGADGQDAGEQRAGPDHDLVGGGDGLQDGVGHRWVGRVDPHPAQPARGVGHFHLAHELRLGPAADRAVLLGAQDYGHRRGRQDPGPGAEKLSHTGSVSYTHLDVYKRQTPSSPQGSALGSLSEKTLKL